MSGASGKTHAERLCAGVLAIEGFSAVDPQHPLGGPDGLKDVLCRRGVISFVAAAYFPATAVTFSKIQAKFEADLEGVERNGARGFVFLVNQPLTISERQALKDLADMKSETADLYHLERLRSVLDSPRGCGLRLEYLNIPMTHEEQIAFWSSANIDLAAKLDRIEALQLRTLHQVQPSEDDILRRTTAMLHALRSGVSSTYDRPAPAGGPWRTGPASTQLDLPMLLWMHRLLLGGSGLPETLVGELRTMSVTIESGDGSSPSYTPPAPEGLPTLVRDWCESWRTGYSELQATDSDGRLDAITSAYCEFLRIHPFTDGNGRMARAILDQMLRELLATSLPPSFTDARVDHQAALQKADAGDLGPLRAFMVAALS